MDHYDLELDPQFDGLIGRHASKAWSKFVSPDNAHLCSDDALSFCGGLLKYDHQERLLAIEAMDHPYFAPVKQAAAESGQGTGGASSSASATTRA